MKHTTEARVSSVVYQIRELEQLKSQFHLTKHYDNEKDAVMEITERLSYSDMETIARLIDYRIKDLEDLTVSNYPSYD